MEDRYLRCDRLADMLRWVAHSPTTRKGDLLAIAWSRHVWEWLGPVSRELVEEFEAFLDEPEGANYTVADDMVEPFRRDSDRAPEQIVELFDALPTMFGLDPAPADYRTAIDNIGRDYRRGLGLIIHEIYGNPFRSVVVEASWLTTDARLLAGGIYTDRAFDRMPILADALQDAGCDNDDILNHCRGPGPHVRGCWVIDLVLGKE